MELHNDKVEFVQQVMRKFANFQVADAQEHVGICLNDTQLLFTILYACLVTQYVARKITEMILYLRFNSTLVFSYWRGRKIPTLEAYMNLWAILTRITTSQQKQAYSPTSLEIRTTLLFIVE